MKLAPLAARVAALVLPLLAGCGQGPTIDSSSDEAFKASVQEVSASLDAATREQFESAMQALLFAGFEGKNLFEMSADAESGGMERRFKATLDGKTAAEVIAEADALKSDREIKEQQASADELVALERKLDEDARTGADLSKFEVHRSRFDHSSGSFMGNGVIELTVTNSTDHAVSRVYLDARLSTPGREVPWVEGPFNYSIPGGMESGESDTWLLSPNMFGDWNNVPADRHDMVLTVEVVRLDGADGESLFSERFSSTDAEAARKAIERAGGEASERARTKLAAWERARSDRFAIEQRRQVAQEIEELEKTDENLAAFKLESVKHVKSDRMFSNRELRISVTNGTPHAILHARYAVRIHSPGREVPWAEGTAYFKFDGGLEPGEKATDSSYPDFLARVPFDERDDILIELTLLSLDDASDEMVLERKEDASARLGALRKIADLI